MTSDPARAHARRDLVKPVVIWAVVATLLVAAAVSSVGAVNRDVYGPGSFVRGYLDALSDQDAHAALSIPGVELTGGQSANGLPEDASRVLLRNSMTSDIRDVEIVGNVEARGGIREITVDYVLGTTTTRSVFTLEQDEPLFGIFQSWRFAESPLAAVSLTVRHETVFDVNGLKLDTRSTQPDQPDPFKSQADYLVFAPGAYTFSHKSRLLTGAPVTATVTQPQSTTAIEVTAEANDEFVKSVQSEVDTYLDDCASQEVLLPSGCPFGKFIENRLQGLPKWSIAEYPQVTLTSTESNWVMDQTDGIAHLSGTVQSLFDGSVSELADDVPFTLGLTASIRPDGSLDIRVH